MSQSPANRCSSSGACQPGNRETALDGMVRRRRFRDGVDRRITVQVDESGDLRDSLRTRLVEMYRTFDARDRTRGLPPQSDADVVNWLDGLFVPGSHHAVAVHEGAAVGHAMLVPDGESVHEFAFFVRGDYQGVGIGSELRDAVLAVGRERGVDTVWLVIGGDNHVAVHVCEQADFERVQETYSGIRMRRRLS